MCLRAVVMALSLHRQRNCLALDGYYWGGSLHWGHGDSTLLPYSSPFWLYCTVLSLYRQRNYLEVYRYDGWGGSGTTLPHFEVGQQFIPSELLLKEGRTEPPPLLSEADLLGLMDKVSTGFLSPHNKVKVSTGFLSPPQSQVHSIDRFRSEPSSLGTTSTGFWLRKPLVLYPSYP